MSRRSRAVKADHRAGILKVESWWRAEVRGWRDLLQETSRGATDHGLDESDYIA